MALFASLFSDLSERRTHPSNPAKWLLYALGGGIDTSAGIRVDEETAMRLTAVYACVRVLAESVSSLPLILYRRIGKGKERATSHSLYSLMHDQPNPEMTSMNYRETCMGHLGLWGNAYSGKGRNGAGKIVELWPLRPDKTEVKRIDGNLWYIYRPDGGKVGYYPRDQILHIPGLSYNGINGLSPISQAREAVGIAFGAEETAARFYSQGMRAGGVFEHPEQLSDSARANLKKSLNDAIGGSSNFHRPLVLEEGMKWHQLSVPPDDAQFLETRKYQLEDIARIYRVPLHLLGHLERMTYNNVEQLGVDFVVHTIRPWLVRLEQAYNQQLLTEAERKEGFFFEFLVDGLLRGDAKSRNEAYSIGVQWGWLSRNDVRELENLNPKPELDDYLVPLNMITASSASQEPPPIEEDGLHGDIEKRTTVWEGERKEKTIQQVQQVRDSFRHLFEDAAQRIVNKEVKAVRRMVKKHFDERNLSELLGELDTFYSTLPDYIKEIMGPVVRTYSETYGPMAMEFIKTGGEIPPQFTRHIENYLEVLAKRYTASSVGQLKALARDVPLNELRDEMLERLNQWSERKAIKIARNEPNRLLNFGSMKLWEGEGVTRHRWVTTGAKTCPYCVKVSETDFGMGPGIVSIDRPFVDGPVHAQHDVQITDDEGNVIGTEKKWATMSSRTIMHPPLHGGCDCMVLPEF